MTETFYERCGVGLLDLGYPSNRATFGKLVHSTPSLLMRLPGMHHKMFKSEDLNHEKHHISIQTVADWGVVAPSGLFRKIIFFHQQNDSFYP